MLNKKLTSETPEDELISIIDDFTESIKKNNFHVYEIDDESYETLINEKCIHPRDMAFVITNSTVSEFSEEEIGVVKYELSAFDTTTIKCKVVQREDTVLVIFRDLIN